MKLLHTGSLNLHEFPEDNPPRYGTLSYTWGPPADELSHRDVKDGADLCVRTSPSAHRVKLASQRAREMGYDYIWIDTLCIDQTSSAEVSEGVNASYRWISKADCCLVHLSDLPASSSPDTSCIDEEELRRCRWFRRGWTLQELVAPRQLVLYDCDWNRRGDKKTETVRQLLARVSGVEEAVLEDPACVRGISLGRRMAWAAGRLTSRPEDRAYSLLGLCGVNMPIIYGEGDRAFFRLQEEVLKNSVDLSLLLWRQAPLLGHRRRRSSFGASEDGGDGDNAAYHSSGDEDCGHTAWHSRHGDRSRGGQMFRGILARSPDEFAHITTTCDYALRTPFQSDAEIQFTNKGLCARVPVVPAAAYGVGSHGGTRDLVMYVGKLTGTREDAEHYGILLRECEPGVFVRASPERIVKIPAPSGSNEGGWRKICVRRDVDEVSSRKIYAEQPDSRVNSWMADVYQEKDNPALKELHHSTAPSRIAGRDDAPATVQQEALEPRKPQRATTELTPPASSLRSRRRSKRSAADMETGQTAAVAAQGALWSGDVDGARESTSSDEDDVLLFDSLPEKPAPLSATHPFQQLRHKVTRLGLKKWQEYIAPSGPRPSRGPVSGSLRHQTFQSLINALSLRPHKRARVQGWNAHDEAALGHTQSGFNDDDGQESYTGESSASDPDIVRVERRQLLACPFYRLDATRYAACLHGVELTSARAVAQHVIVDHRAPAYCPDCYLTFPTAAARDAHIVARTCEQKDGPEDDAALQGISEEQVEALAAAVSSRVRVVRAKKGVKKGPHRLRRGKQHATRKPTEIEKWQRILAIVSSRNRPNTTTGAIQCMSEALRRPLSPYLVSPEEQQALRLRRFWLAKGQAIVASVVREQDPSAWDDGKFGDEAALESLHWAVLDDLMQAWFSFVRGGEQQQLQDGGQQHAAEQDV